VAQVPSIQSSLGRGSRPNEVPLMPPTKFATAYTAFVAGRPGSDGRARQCWPISAYLLDDGSSEPGQAAGPLCVRLR
jgi:hypothetical protein